jgi:tetratricopeptide (TPR) repeat protein
LNFEFLKPVRGLAVFVIIGLSLSLLPPTVLAESSDNDLVFLAGFPFKTLPWPASLEKNTLQIKTDNDLEKTPKWKILWDQAREQAMSGHLRLSIETYRQALALKPSLAEANWELANILFALNDYQKSQAIIELLTEQNPERFDYLNGLAVLDLKLGKFSPAADIFERLYRQSPANINALAGAIYGYLAAKQPKAALPLLKKLAGLADNAPDLERFLGYLAYEQGDYETASKAFLTLVQDEAAAPQLLLYTARSLDLLGQPLKAVIYWQGLLIKKPDTLEAHKWLADYFEKEGQVEKALPHLLFLYQQKKDDASLLKRLGRCYVGLKEFPQALSYFQKYMLLKPDDTEVARFVVSLQAASGNKSETLAALEDYFKLESHPGKANLEKAAKLYGEKGLYRQALGIWRKLLDLTPDNPEILGAMAHNFLAIGKNEEALKVWKKLAGISPNVIDVYRPMATLLERMGRQQELIEVLESIHDLRPAEQDVTLKLAILYLRQKRYDQGGNLLAELGKAGCRKAEFFYWHAIWAESQNDLLLALHEYESFLRLTPARQDVKERCMVIAGRMGRLGLVQKYFDILIDTISSSTDLRLKAAAAFQNCGAYDRAETIFKQVLNMAAKGPGWPENSSIARQAGQAAAGLADIYQEDGRGYEAEQFLRMGLVISRNNVKFLAKLFDLSLSVGDIKEAGEWFELLLQESGADSWYTQLREAKLRSSQGNTRQAARLIRSLSKIPDSGGSLTREDWRKRNLDLAQFLNGKDSERAVTLCQAVLAKEPQSMRANIILTSLGRTSRSCSLAGFDTLTAVELLEYARLAQENGQPWLMERAAKRVIKEIPDSLIAAIIVARSLSMRQDPAAAKAWGKLAAANPANSFIVARGAKAAFLSGNIDKALALCRSLKSPRPDVVLLEARILWMQNDWSGALEIYRKFLEPGVDSLLRRAASELAVQYVVPVKEKSFWQRLSPTPVTSPVADYLMNTASFAYDRSRTAANPDESAKGRRFQLAVCRLFGLYRWQNKFSAELLVRESVQRRAYFMAQRRYESLIAKYPADKSLLFDLAGVFSQLGRLDDEAAIYDKLIADGINFPGLLEDARRNKLKRQPRGTIALTYQEEEGRNDYKDMRITSQNVAFQISPRTGEKIKLNLRRNNYHGVNADGTLRASRVMAAYQARVLNRLTVNLGGGVESLDRSGGNIALLDLRVAGKLTDKLSARASYQQDIVADTLVSVDRGIYKQDLGAGLSFEPMARLALGGDYDHLKYSDDNWTTNYDLWSTFLIHSEPLFLQLRYKYDFKDSADGTGNENLLADDLPLGAHPYWAPKNYWANQVGVYFKHLLSPAHLNRDIPKYYTLEYYLGHDSGGYGFQTLKSSFCLDFNSHFMMQAQAELYSSAVYRKKQISLSASYRW